MDSTGRGWLFCMVVYLALTATLLIESAARAEADTASQQQVVSASADEPVDFSFAGTFPKPLYQKSYFAWLMLGASMVVAGVLTYFTAGAGAPAAATGVSTVASTVAGGGAGSYMAGLSIIGGWFGGNAMLGSAILNGIAFGLGGGGAAYATLPALGKVGVLSSVTATALDGVLVYLPPDKKQLVYRVRLPVPDRIGSGGVKKLVDDLNDAEADLVKLVSKLEEAKSESDAEVAADLESEIANRLQEKKSLEGDARKLATGALKNGASPEDLLVLAIVSKNAGHPDTFAGLLRRIPPEQVANRSYLDYLNAVTSVERGELRQAENLLRTSWGASSYAVEPALLLVNLLGNKTFKKNETAVLEVVKRAEQQVERDKYVSSYSILALYYRVGAMYFNAGRYEEAQEYYEKAYAELPWTQKYVGSAQLRNMIRLGIANSLYGQGQRYTADALFADVLDDAKTDSERQRLQSQYVPNVAKGS